MEKSAEEVAELGFDQVLQELRDAVHRLEAGNASLEDSLGIYEAGVRLARRGHSLLDNAEKRVEVLVRESREGPVVAAFESNPDGRGDDEPPPPDDEPPF